MRVEEYLDYVNQPLNFIQDNKISAFILSGIMSIFFAITQWIGNSMLFLSSVLIINVAFIYLYFALSFADLFAGIYVSVFKNKEKFESKKFLKKILLIGMGILMLGMTVILSNTFLFYEDKENAILRGLLDGIVFLFEGVKITMIIFFVIYELTSLREKAEKMKWNSLINLLDVFLIPFIKIQNFVNRKIDKTLEDEEDNKTEKLLLNKL